MAVNVWNDPKIILRSDDAVRNDAGAGEGD